jgi:hypothetical protein
VSEQYGFQNVRCNGKNLNTLFDLSFFICTFSCLLHASTFSAIWVLQHFDGFGGLVVCVLASSSRVRGFEPGRSRWDFFLRKKSSARLPSEGKLNNLSHVPTSGHVKDPFRHSVLRADSGIPTVPSFANRWLSRRMVRWRLWR